MSEKAKLVILINQQESKVTLIKITRTHPEPPQLLQTAAFGQSRAKCPVRLQLLHNSEATPLDTNQESKHKNDALTKSNNDKVHLKPNNALLWHNKR